MKQQALLLILILFSLGSRAQELSSLREKTILLSSDTITLDTLMIFPESIKVWCSDSVIPATNYHIDTYRALFIPGPQLVSEHDSLLIRYRVWPYPINQNHFHKKLSQIISTPYQKANRYSINRSKSNQDPFSYNTIQKQGSIFRGLSFGSNQDFTVRSDLNLQLSGYLNDRIQILAALSDNNIPLQPDGNTQQIQDFDRIFIKLFDDSREVTLGDYEIKSPSGSFMQFHKKVQGGKFSGLLKTNKNGSSWKTTLSGSLSKGKYNRMQIKGIEGVQGPYRLVGQNNESYIIVIAGTERVYINGKALTRGQQHDYIINYNTAELSFTPNTPINRNSRITVEFEYSEENFPRMLLYNTTEYHQGNSNFRINVYSEQDRKNQPLNQTLNQSQKELLRAVGDQLDMARVVRADTVPFSSDKILYRSITRTIEGKSYHIYQYSTNPDSANYRVSFSYVGEKKGNYQPVAGAANGRVYRWIDPINGIPQGNYAPVVQLIAPQKKQMVTIGGEYRIDSTTYTSFELAMSSRDLNTFSSIGDNDNNGYAFKMDIARRFTLKDTLLGLYTNISYQNLHRHFSEITPFRSVEFEREWNLPPTLSPQGESLLQISGTLRHTVHGESGYKLSLLHRKDGYQGLNHRVNTRFRKRGLSISFEGDLLNSSQNEFNTRFLKHNMEITQSISLFTMGITTESEHNEWRQLSDKALEANSFAFHSYKLFIRNREEHRNKYSIHYQIRKDYSPYDLRLKNSSRSEDLGIGFQLQKNPVNQIKTTLLYRKLHLNSTTSTEEPENTLLGRIEHQLIVKKGVLRSRTFYEVGSGMEAEKEFIYLEVVPGQGIYRWKDYNENQIQEINEFEIATFQDEANYIRIYSPTNTYQRVYTNEFNQIININFHQLNYSRGIGKIVSAFSNRLAYRINQKHTNNSFGEYANPFRSQQNSAELISLSSNIQNTLTYKQKGAKTTWDYLYLESRTKQLLSYGFDLNYLKQHGIRLQRAFKRSHQIINRIDWGRKRFSSQFFNQKNYFIHFIKQKLNLNFQPTDNFQCGIEYIYQSKDNQTGPEELQSHNIGSSFKCSIAKKGSLEIDTHYLKNHFNASTNTPIAYEIMEGFLPGNNLTWQMGYTQKLSKIFHLRLSYSGRHSDGESIIHTSNMELRAQF